MAIPVLIIGKSGTGKSTSLRNFNQDEIVLFNVCNKPLPFRNDFKYIINTDKYKTIKDGLGKMPANVAVIDDAGYLITNQFMRNHGEKSSGNGVFNLYNDLAKDFWGLMEYITTELPNDKTVYVIMHEDKSDAGDVKPKTIGRMLDEKVCLEGMFTIVLRSLRQDGKYLFKTQSNGLDVCKSPIDMFTEEFIDNDLKVIDEIIRNYYQIKED